MLKVLGFVAVGLLIVTLMSCLKVASDADDEFERMIAERDAKTIDDVEGRDA